MYFCAHSFNEPETQINSQSICKIENIFIGIKPQKWHVKSNQIPRFVLELDKNL